MGSPNKVIVFGRDNCEWCDKAIDLLATNQIEMTYIPLKTVPVIIVNGEYIGGYTELEKLING